MADPERLEAWPDAREKDRRLVDRMLALFDLEQVAPDRFRAGGAETEPRRIFGGQFVAQALEAAVRTVAADRRAHSVHGYFLRSGVTSRDSEFLVSSDADGSNHSFRRVVVSQAGRPLLTLSAAFQAAGEGLAHQVQAPDVPSPETLQDDCVRAEGMPALSPGAHAALARGSPFQFRSTILEARFRSGPAPAHQQYWFRTARPISEASQALHRTILAYASDTMLLGAALMPHEMRWFDGQASVASLDHALWIHRDVRADDWLLYDQESPWAGEGRALNRGHIFDRQGRLVATVAQEGSLRTPTPVHVDGQDSSRGPQQV